MKKILLRTLTVLGLLVLAGNIYVAATGKWFVYRVLQYTVCKGKLGPDIHEYTKDALGRIDTEQPLPTPLHALYNTKKPSKAFFALADELGTTSFLVYHHDSLLFETYFDSYTADSLSNSFSMAKTVVAMLVGCAIQDGFIGSTDDPVSKYVPWFDPASAGKLRIKHLLSMSSGIDFTENYINPAGFAAEVLYGNNLKAALLPHKVTGIPGSTFNYQSGNTQLLCFVVEAATGKPMYKYASEKLWKPLHASREAYWSLDAPGGEPRAFCCFNSNARDFARVGMLLMHHGKMFGKQVLDSAYVEQATHPVQMMDGNKPNRKYGYQLWMMEYKGKRVFYARGILGQYIICIPSDDLLVVRLGHRRSSEKTDDHPVDVFRYIDTGLALIR